jgi:flagellar motor switch protein FliN/FliY
VADRAAISLRRSLDSTATLAIGRPTVSPLPERPGTMLGSPLVDLVPPGACDAVVVLPNSSVSAAKRTRQPSPKRRPDLDVARREPRGAESDTRGASEAAVYAEALMKIRVPVAAVLAERRLPMGQVLRIAPGSILRFGTMCDQPLELEVGGRRIAAGEAVAIGERLGLRITALLR